MFKPFWLSWVEPPEADLILMSPWWFRKFEHETHIYAAIMAADEGHAVELVFDAYDQHDEDAPLCLDVRYVIEAPHGWQPFSRKRPRCDWMIWGKPH